MSSPIATTTKRAYNKAPKVIKVYLDKESKKTLMKCFKNHPKMVKKEEKRAKKEEAKEKKKEEKKAIREEKLENDKKKRDNLTVEQKRYLVEQRNMDLINCIPDLTNSQRINLIDYLVEKTNDSTYLSMVKTGMLEKKEITRDIPIDGDILKLGAANPKTITMMGNERVEV